MRNTESAWLEAKTDRSAARLDSDLSCDVCVIGAGVAGLTTAYNLAGEGKKVVVLDARPELAGGESAYTTAHLASVIDDRFSTLIGDRGEPIARRAYQAHAAAIDRIEATAEAENIACDLVRLDAYLFLGEDDARDALDEEEEAARRLGVPVERLARAPVADPPDGPCLKFPNQGRFHPLKYLAGLARAVRRRGGRLFGGTRVVEVEGGSPCRVATADGHAVAARRRRGGHEHAAQRRLSDQHQQRRVYHLRRRRPGSPRGRGRRPVLGHPGPVPLRPPARRGRRGRQDRPADRRRRGPQDRPGQRPGGPLGEARGLGAGALPGRPRRGRPVVRPGVRDHRRAGPHRPQPVRRGERLHRDRRLRHGDDARHHRRHPAGRPDRRPRQRPGQGVRADPAAAEHGRHAHLGERQRRLPVRATG